MNNWCVYMLRCSDDSLYTGATTNLQRRFDEHTSGNGSKYVKSRLPAKPVYIELGHNRSSALKRENEIKSLPKSKKEDLASDTYK